MLLRVLVLSPLDLAPQLKGTFIGRHGIDAFRADGMAQIRLLASTLGPQLILVDGDLPDVRDLLQALRAEPTTRERSIVVLNRLGRRDSESDFLNAGANAVVRWPPDSEWDARLSRLMAVPTRLQTRIPVQLSVETEPDCTGAIDNLSVGGMLLRTRNRIPLEAPIGFRFWLADGTQVQGRGRVAREARGVGYGVEFTELADDQRDAINQYLRSSRLG
jgi:DNA-binding response OmpR family regulator